MFGNSFKIKIRRWAADDYFNRVGFADVLPVPQTIKKKYEDWIDRGYHGTMAWMEKTSPLRLNPSDYFPEVKSAIVFLHSYHHPVSDESDSLPVKIAKYAHGKDYHKILKKKLIRLVKKMADEFGSFNYVLSVDSAPVLERYWARQSGLGWQGKNTMLISPDSGSYHFISLIFSDLDIQPDEPFEKDFCGNCSACLSACPTNAILPDKIIDANKCISYLTIEHKDEIDHPLSNAISPWVFGCDICQEVCPWNKFSVITDELRFHEQYQRTEIKDLINHYSDSKFSAYFAGTPLKRAGSAHFKYILGLMDNRHNKK